MTATLDSWYNPNTGVGGTGDKSSGFIFNPHAHLGWQHTTVLAAIYEADALAATAVDAVVDDAYQRGWSVAGSMEPQQAEATIDWCDKLQVRQRLMSARKWSRLYGRGAVYIGSDDSEDQSMPLRFGGSVHFLQSYEKDELQPTRYYEHPLQPKFGEPSHYRLTPIMSGGSARGYGYEIHESRFVVFDGVETTKTQRVQNNGCGSSVLIRPMDALRQLNGAYALALSLLADANQNIYKMKDFAALLLAGKEELIQKRIAIIDRFRSSVNALLVDADTEDFVRSQLALAGLDSLLTKYEQRAATAYRMPVTVLFGTSPAGMNATGESDLRNWHKQVQSEQNDEQKPALEKVLRVIFNARNGPTAGIEPATWKIEFPSLWEPTEAESANIESVQAQTDQIYVDMQVIKPHHVAKARFSGEPGSIRLGPEEIAELEQAEAPLHTAPLDDDAPLALEGAAVPPDTQDADQAVDAAVAAFAEMMTEKQLRACEHDKKNRCRICGIERVRRVDVNDQGQAVWAIEWRPIGAQTANAGLAQAEPTPAQDSATGQAPVAAGIA